jgi:hypothetical protein
MWHCHVVSNNQTHNKMNTTLAAKLTAAQNNLAIIQAEDSRLLDVMDASNPGVDKIEAGKAVDASFIKLNAAKAAVEKAWRAVIASNRKSGLHPSEEAA